MPPKASHNVKRGSSGTDFDFKSTPTSPGLNSENLLKWSDVKSNMLKREYSGRSTADMDEFSYTAVARLLKHVGFDSISSQALLVLSQLLEAYYLHLLKTAQGFAEHARRTQANYYDVILALIESDTKSIPSPLSMIEQELTSSSSKPIHPIKEPSIAKEFKPMANTLLNRGPQGVGAKRGKEALNIETNVKGIQAGGAPSAPVTAGGSKLTIASRARGEKQTLVRPDYVPSHLPHFPQSYTYSQNAYTGPPPPPLSTVKTKIHREAYLALDALTKLMESGDDDSRGMLRLIFPEVLDVTNYELAAEAADIAARLRMYADISGTPISLRAIFDAVHPKQQEEDEEEEEFGTFRDQDLLVIEQGDAMDTSGATSPAIQDGESQLSRDGGQGQEEMQPEREMQPEGQTQPKENVEMQVDEAQEPQSVDVDESRTEIVSHDVDLQIVDTQNTE